MKTLKAAKPYSFMGTKLPATYLEVLDALKEKIRQARLKAALSVNAQLLQLYWEIGNTILKQQKEKGWGAKVIDQLATDLKAEFPDMKGLSLRNLKYMRAFAAAYPSFSIVQAPLAQLQPRATDAAGYATGKNEKPILQRAVAKLPPPQFVQAPLAQISWYHHITLLEKVKAPDERMFYIRKTIENGWSRNVMLHHINNNLYKRQGKALTNFEVTLPKPQSDLARETLKNPYVFDFLSISEEIQEREVERALIRHIKKFMLELGKGFAYVGNQYNLNAKTMSTS